MGGSVAGGSQQRHASGFPLAPHDGVDRAPGLVQDVVGDERDRVPTYEGEGRLPLFFEPVGQVDHLGQFAR